MTRIAALLLALCLVGCTSTTTDDPNDLTSPDVVAPDQPVAIETGDGGTLTPPAQANYTIFLRDFTGPDHAAAAESAKGQAQAAGGGLDDYYVVRGEDRSVLYHGFYSGFDPDTDPRDGRRAQRDHATISAMTVADANGRPLPAFPRAVFKPLDRAAPEAPADWDLRQTDAHWTVAIAVYTDPQRRKRATVDSVRAARASGVEAYYLHDGPHSYVCVGTWPKKAVRLAEDVRRKVESIDPNFPRPLVLTDGELPPLVQRHIERSERMSGQSAVRVDAGSTVEVVDQSLLATMKAYPYSVNGEPERDVPLLVNVPQSLGREVREVRSAPTDRELDALLQRPL